MANAASPAPRRISGKPFALVFVALLTSIVGALALSFLCTQDVEGEVLLDVPLAGDGVEPGEHLVIRRGLSTQHGVAMMRLRADGSEVWRRLLFGLQEGTVPQIVDGLLSVRTQRSSNLHETHAFRVEDAEFAWGGAAPSPPLDGTGAPGPSFVADGVLTEVYEGDPGELVGVDHQTGEERYRVALAIPDASSVTLTDGELRVPGASLRCYRQRTGAAIECAAP